MPIEHLLPELVLALGAVAVILVAAFVGQPRQWLCAPLAFAVVATSSAAALWLHGRSGIPVLTAHGTWAIDAIMGWSRAVILLTGAVVILLSPRWFVSDRRHGEWYGLLLLSTLGATLLAGASDLSLLMVAVLLSSVTGYTMASYHRASRICAEAGAKFYFLGAIANPVLFLGLVFVYGVAGTTGYGAIAGELVSRDLGGVALSAGFGMILVGLTFKLGAVPVHAWVPDVAQGSPAPAAAFITVAPKVGALLALARIASLLPDAAVAWRAAIAVIALATMTLGNLAALWQQDVRRLIGWSSVSQVGYGLLAVVALGRSPLALSSLALFMAAYALANLTAFAVVVSLRGRTKLDDYKGLGRVRPAHAAALTVAFLSLAGVPPLVGFTAKLALFAAVMESGYTWLALAAVANTVISLFYYLRVIGAMFLVAPLGNAALLGREALGVCVIGAMTLVLVGIMTQSVIAALEGSPLLP